MLENTVEMVALAMHTDRQATANHTRRSQEAAQTVQRRQTSERRSYRQAIAGMLCAVASRLAPHGAAGDVAIAR